MFKARHRTARSPYESGQEALSNTSLAAGQPMAAGHSASTRGCQPEFPAWPAQHGTRGSTGSLHSPVPPHQNRTSGLVPCNGPAGNSAASIPHARLPGSGVQGEKGTLIHLSSPAGYGFSQPFQYETRGLGFFWGGEVVGPGRGIGKEREEGLVSLTGEKPHFH